MKWGTFSDIEPDIKQALQRRKVRIRRRNLKEYSKSSFLRVLPLSIVDLGSKIPGNLTEQQRTDATADRYILGMQASGVKDPLSSYTTKYSAKDKKGNKYTYGYNRPAAGLTGLSVQYEGYSGKGLVRMQLKGIINTLEDLDIYKPILFTPGKYWMLEWGYLPNPDKAYGDGIKNNLINIKEITTLYAQRRLGDIYNKVEEHRTTTKGTAEIQVAVVNNYEYTLNAAGSFEFTVDFLGNSTLFRTNTTAAAGSGFKPETATFTDAEGNPISKEQFDELTGKANINVNSEEWATSFDVNKMALAGVFASTDALRVEPGVEQMNLDIIEKFNAATPSDFFKSLKNYIIECYKSSGMNTEPDPHGVFNIDRMNPSALPAKPVNPAEPVAGRSELNVKKHGIYYEVEKVPMIQAGQKFDYGLWNNELGPYVTWGWFEDNILNVVYGKNKDDSKPMKWESVDQDGVPLPLNSHKYLYTTTPNELIIPGRMPEMLEHAWTSGMGGKGRTHMYRHAGNVTMGRGTDPSSEGNFMVRGTGEFEYDKNNPRPETDIHTANMMVDKTFGAYHPIVYDYIAISESALGFDEDINNTLANESDAVGAGLVNLAGLDANELADMAGYVTDQDLYDEREVLIRTKSGERGSIRRLVLHYKLIQESFINASTPIEGLKILLHKIENMGYKGFWDFDIFEVDNKMGVYEKNSLDGLSEEVLNKVREQIKQRKIDSKKQVDTPKAGEAFVFPTWNADDGFVLNQNLTVKMPTKQMLAMVYANSAQGMQALKNASFGNNDDAQVFSAISAGDDGEIQKISADPGFQGSLIDVVKSVNITGKPVTARIPTKYISIPSDDTLSNKMKDKDVEILYIGDKRVEVDDDVSGKHIFQRGASIDAHGMMYENVKNVMQHRLSKTWMKEGERWIKISGKDTRVFDTAELSIKISGLSGLNWGNQFHTDYIEERFKDEVIFFVTKVNHEINENNWTTEIIGQMRGIFNSDYIKEKVALTTEEDRYISIQLTEADNMLAEKMSKDKMRGDILVNSGRFNRIMKGFDDES